MTPADVAAARAFCQRLNDRAAAGGRAACWFEARPGPNYVKILLHHGRAGVRDAEPGAFCFVARTDAPFGWHNYRAGDVLPPMTFRKPWKMDTGAVASVHAPDGGISYWVDRYGRDLGLW